ncbi:serine hydrolase [Hoeflea sp.]|uniref:serine hydrolase n=1 Tax=Hoeflea sp. TaxID=1940281 RepID=UPI003BAA9BB0
MATLAKTTRAEWGIYVRFLANGEEIAIGAERPHDTMSTIKIPILVALMRAVEAGKADLSERVTLTQDDKRLGTGVLLLFDEGATFTVRDAAWLMTVISDNTATDICLRAAGGIEAVNETMKSLGLDDIRMTGDALSWFQALAGSMDPDASDIAPGDLVRNGYRYKEPGAFADARRKFHFEIDNPFSLATPRAMGELMAQINDGRCASAETCSQIMEFLRGQQLRERVPKYSWGTKGAHKTGSYMPFIANDIGLFTPAAGTPVIISIMAQKHDGDPAMIDDCIARMGEAILHAAEAR